MPTPGIRTPAGVSCRKKGFSPKASKDTTKVGSRAYVEKRGLGYLHGNIIFLNPGNATFSAVSLLAVEVPEPFLWRRGGVTNR
jgi:hypothetical protein